MVVLEGVGEDLVIVGGHIKVQNQKKLHKMVVMGNSVEVAAQEGQEQY